MKILSENKGKDEVGIFLKSTKQIKKLGSAMTVNSGDILALLKDKFGTSNVQVQ